MKPRSYLLAGAVAVATIFTVTQRPAEAQTDSAIVNGLFNELLRQTVPDNRYDDRYADPRYTYRYNAPSYPYGYDGPRYGYRDYDRRADHDRHYSDRRHYRDHDRRYSERQRYRDHDRRHSDSRTYRDHDRRYGGPYYVRPRDRVIYVYPQGPAPIRVDPYPRSGHP